MSKRRNRNSNANIPQETLERARQQAAAANTNVNAAADDDEPEVVESKPARVEPAAPRARSTASAAARRGSGAQSVRKRKSDDKMSPEIVADILAHPTKVVTEDELRSQYGFVIADLRNMGLLALGLMVALVVLAQILPR
jgi:hypothetical protein